MRKVMILAVLAGLLSVTPVRATGLCGNSRAFGGALFTSSYSAAPAVDPAVLAQLEFQRQLNLQGSLNLGSSYGLDPTLATNAVLLRQRFLGLGFRNRTFGLGLNPFLGIGALGTNLALGSTIVLESNRLRGVQRGIRPVAPRAIVPAHRRGGVAAAGKRR